MTSDSRSPQGSTRGPSGGAPGSGTNGSTTSPPPGSDLEPLVEIQERLPLLLPITAPDTLEQGAELRELTDQVVRESGGEQVQIFKMLQEMDDA